MAAAEARAVWQRAANRCFVQEDAKRAPKLACPSAYPSSKQADLGPTNTPDGLDNPSVGFMPLNRNSSYSSVPPESRWWLQIQSTYVNKQDVTYEQINRVRTEMENCDTIDSSPNFKCSDENGDPLMCVPKEESCKSEMSESYGFLEMASVGSSVSKKGDELGFDSDSPWIGDRKMEPWWRVADRDELASFVSQRSLELIENCDLPWPQSKPARRDLCGLIGNYDRVPILHPSNDLKTQKDTSSCPEVGTDGIFTVESAWRKKSALCGEEARFGSDRKSRNSDDMTHEGLTKPVENIHTKAQLMEALCHSQTRAREAEKAAKQANDEKEDILKLFFKQASQLFAYKQWFQILQLENLYLHIKNSNEPLTTLFPVVLPWAPNKPTKLPKNGHRGKRNKPSCSKQDIGKYAVAFAVGLGLVGTGLLLGWTVAWILPAF